MSDTLEESAEMSSPPPSPHSRALSSATPSIDDRPQILTPQASWVEGFALCLMATTVLLLAGEWTASYSLGVGNQGIQIAFLRHWANPEMFANDPMVVQTLPAYPSLFFRGLAPLLRFLSLPMLYACLQALTTFALLASVYTLSRSMFRRHGSAILAVLLVCVGQYRALAGDTIYADGFTHTYFALPVALFGLAFAFQRRWIVAFAIAGVLFNIHALTAAYLMAMLATGYVWEYLAVPSRTATKIREPLSAWLMRGMAAFFFFVALAVPTLMQMALHRETFDAAWLSAMRLRSSEHSFPLSWWAMGNPDWPGFAIFFALGALAMSFLSSTENASTLRSVGRLFTGMVVGTLILFVAGILFTEVWPIPLIIRLQAFRASRLLLLLLLLAIANGIVGAFLLAWHGRTESTSVPSQTRVSMLVRVMEGCGAALLLATMAIPTLQTFLPITLVVATAVAFITGRLSGLQSIVAVAAMTVVYLAWKQIAFPLPGIVPSTGESFSASLLHLEGMQLRPATMTLTQWLLLGALAITIWSAILVRIVRRFGILRIPLLAMIVLIGALSIAGWTVHATETVDDSPLAGVSAWARQKTPADAIFLTAPGLSNFRIFSHRGIVGDWRDGTQLYFSSAFLAPWSALLPDLQPGLVLSTDNSRVISPGNSLSSLDSQALLALTQKYHAAYILLKKSDENTERTLETAYEDDHFIVFKPQLTADANAVPPGVVRPKDWLAIRDFMNTTVARNIEKYRKSDVTIQVVDSQGRPVSDLPATLEQTSHTFKFGVSLGFFDQPKISPGFDEPGSPITAAEKEIAPKIFNASMIPFSSKWMYTEPTDGHPTYSDLDQYVDFCTQNQMAMEYHFLAGYPPQFLRVNHQLWQQRFLAHAEEIVARYSDKIAYWQLTNEQNIIQAVPPVYKSLREKYPNLKLGIADCVKFDTFEDGTDRRDMDMYKGFSAFMWLKKQGVKLDYFGIHGHRPIGLWADPRMMYTVFDKFANEGVKIHVTEMLLPIGSPIVGHIRRGTWNEALQAEFMKQYLATCFSYPQVELVNFWGLKGEGWGESSGLLNEKEQPRKELDTINDLIHKTWHTHVSERLALDGRLKTRAFQGSYTFSIAGVHGKTVTLPLEVPVGSPLTVRLCYDAEKGTLTKVESAVH